GLPRQLVVVDIGGRSAMPTAEGVRSTRLRRCSAVTGGIVAALLAQSSIYGIPAKAAEIVTFDALHENLERSEFYGAAEPPARRIDIGPRTTTILLEHGFTPGDGVPVSCGSAQGVIAQSYWTADGWDPTAPHPVAVIGPITPGATYNYHCHQDDTNEVDFTLVADNDAPQVVEVAATPDKLNLRNDVLNHTREGFDTRKVELGDTVQVIGPAGTWGTPDDGAVASIEVTCGRSYRTGVGDVSFADDGTTVELTLPTVVDQACFSADAELEVSTMITTPGTSSTPTITEEVVWRGLLQFSGGQQFATTTSLRLDHPVKFSFLPTEALISIRTDRVPEGTGLLRVYVDGHRSAMWPCHPPSGGPCNLSCRSRAGGTTPLLLYSGRIRLCWDPEVRW
ncbi:MAG: hypothetical protein ABWZ98_13305, partial [Nakamurella sp.]